MSVQEIKAAARRIKKEISDIENSFNEGRDDALEAATDQAPQGLRRDFPSYFDRIDAQIDEENEENRLQDEPEEEYLTAADADPEIWGHLFDDIDSLVEKHKTTGTQSETEAFSDLYFNIKKVMDGALWPSALAEADHVLQGQVPDLLNAIAQKSKAAGAVILEDLRRTYKDNNDKDVRAFGEVVIGQLEKTLNPPAVAKAVVKARKPAL